MRLDLRIHQHGIERLEVQHDLRKLQVLIQQNWVNASGGYRAKYY
jgi:hypothetical protein